MAGKGSHAIEKKNGVFFSIFESELPKWDPQAVSFRSCGGVFASIGQVGVGFDVPSSSSTPPNSRDNGLKIPCNDITLKSIPSEVGVRIVDILPKTGEDELLENLAVKKNEGFKLKFKVSNPSLRRLISGAFAGAVSRTAVAPLETIRTHLMVGNSGHSTGEVFNTIMKTDGWRGLFRGNFVNVIRVAPSKAIELFAYDTVKKMLTPKPEEPLKIPVPPSLIAGACAGISSTLCTYPLELLKTRITIQKGVYNNLLDAFVKIVRDEGPGELYRGLTPSLIGVVPYAATNYFAYDALRKAYKKTFKKDPGNLATLFIGSMAGAISSSTTFPLEVARKQMQVGALGGRRVYNNMLHALICIMEKEGVEGLYKGLGPSCMKLVPAAGIAFMCYEGCKKVLVEDEEPERKGMN